jgi:hypothetical protein
MERYIPDDRYRAHELYAPSRQGCRQYLHPFHQPQARHWIDVLVGSPVYVAFGMLVALAILWFLGGR